MHIDLADVFMDFIKRKVESGLYGNSSEVIRDALRHMMENEDEYNSKLQKLRAAIQVGLDQVERGEYKVWDAKLKKQLMKNAMEKYKKGHKPNPDVVP